MNEQIDFSVKKKAPNAREAQSCLVCIHYRDHGKGTLLDEVICTLYDDYFTAPNWVCDSFEPNQW